MKSKQVDAQVHDRYHVQTPDIIEIHAQGSPLWTGAFEVGPDGQIHPVPGQGLHVEGRSPPEIRSDIAEHLGIPVAGIEVRVSQYRSQKLYIHGQIKGESRALPYRGPETVSKLLQRAGGLASGAVASDIQVVRARIADGTAPEVLHVDLEKVLLDGESKKDPPLLPFDQIYVKETRSSSIQESIPRWLRPLYAKIFGLSVLKRALHSPRLPVRKTEQIQQPKTP